ncbi:chemotaxis protein CheX [Ammoniphilus sp. CFH 90114]|uniref:chemotaxis protein CheX n=1 Tax=Ammoniphilus sp. CFH 90114 TaxID=2493665 RepID=UPI00100DE902|nr:chemotaxis protein CheX [Ammoniphilus sp. CFH 90114]RXT04898.1 chemotaxis protein CheX [Ammoniphilus sp. CFH 90114]
MTISGKNADIVETLFHVVPSVIPFPVSLQQPISLIPSILQPEWGVLIGITGDIRGRLLVKGTSQTFGLLGQNLFGMTLEGPMLESFTGEFGNMIAGNLSAHIYQLGFTIDITPPTLMMGESNFQDSDHGFSIPIEIEQVGNMDIAWLLHK